jgi:DNA modification methylase
MQNELEIETRPISYLRPDPNNARKHDAKNIDAIAKSLARFGQRKPIVIIGDGTIVAGNGTVEAAKQLGWTEIVCARAPWKWTPEEVKAYALADNRTAELAEWDETELAKQLMELEAHGWDIEEFGFKQREIEKPDAPDEDYIPEIPVEPKTKFGQIYKLNNHFLICGDSTREKTLKKLLQDELADCIFTDPPYNVAYQGGTKDKLTIQNDAMTEHEFNNFIKQAYEAMFANTKAGSAIYVCHSDTASSPFREQFVETGWSLKQVLIWVKDRFVLSRQDYNWQHEPILYGWKPGAAHTWHGPFNDSTVLDYGLKEIEKMTKAELVNLLSAALNVSTVIEVDRPSKNLEHPTMKPIALIIRLLSNSAKKDDIILDPFAGAGSTLIAAETLGMRAYLCELDPKYCDVIVKRWENFTGQTAELVN